MKLKYIVVYNEFGRKATIVFSELLTHKQVAGVQQVLSAGFVSVDYDNREVYAYGESVSLGIKSSDEDAKMLGEIFWHD